MVFREMLTQHFWKKSEPSEKLRWAAVFLATMETVGDVASPQYHSATSKNISTIYWWFFSPLIKMHLQNSPSWKQISLQWSTVINWLGNTRMLSHMTHSKGFKENCAADFWLKALGYWLLISTEQPCFQEQALRPSASFGILCYQSS